MWLGGWIRWLGRRNRFSFSEVVGERKEMVDMHGKLYFSRILEKEKGPQKQVNIEWTIVPGVSMHHPQIDR